ncbi:MAG: NfeD family protein [Sideroxydans sp.]|nr:NfeD family protein [Sideroxydans sp.]
MESYIYWFVLGLILLGLEMATGTFYLLMVAIGMAVGGLAALLGAGVVWQLLLCAITVVAGTFILRRRKRSSNDPIAEASFDIGQAVKIIHWNDNGTARVAYRGAEWDAELQSADAPRDGQFYIAAMHGSGLVITHQKSSS